MLDMHRLRECDLSTIDVRSLSPEEWDAVKREVVRRAHAERASMLRHVIARLHAWWRPHKHYRLRAARLSAACASIR